MKDFAINTVIRFQDDVRVKVVEHQCKDTMCENCCFGKIIETRVMGVPHYHGYQCSFSLREETYCSSKRRSDGKNIVYKLMKNKLNNK